MRVAVTGVSGFIGSVLARTLHEAGHSVTGLVRPTSRRDHIEAYVDRFVVGEQDDRSCWPALLADADGVVHNSVDWSSVRAAARDEGWTEHLRSNLCGSIELLWASAPRPFVFVSTVGVHHDMRPRWNGMIDEDHPLRPSSAYGAYKAAVEAHLWDAHFARGRHTVAIRPCAVYGIDPRLDRSHGHEQIAALRRDRAYAKPGGGKFVHVQDVADAIVAGLTTPEASGRPFNLVDCYARWGDLARMAAEEMGLHDAAIDLSSPAEPVNTFVTDAARSLGVRLDRGHDGLRAHIRSLLAAIDAR